VESVVAAEVALTSSTVAVAPAEAAAVAGGAGMALAAAGAAAGGAGAAAAGDAPEEARLSAGRPDVPEEARLSAGRPPMLVLPPDSTPVTPADTPIRPPLTPIYPIHATIPGQSQAAGPGPEDPRWSAQTLKVERCKFKPTLRVESACFQRLKRKYHKLLSSLAFSMK
jgi:hypothetical protein